MVMLGDAFDHEQNIEANYFASFRHSLIELIKSILKIHMCHDATKVYTNICRRDVPHINGYKDTELQGH